MKIEKYFEYRELFESRWQPEETGGQRLRFMKDGIYNFELFLSIYGHDKDIYLTSVVWSINRDKQYTIPFKKNMRGTKIHIRNIKQQGLFDKYPEQYNKLIKALKSA